jgi:hypothetical protein
METMIGVRNQSKVESIETPALIVYSVMGRSNECSMVYYALLNHAPLILARFSSWSPMIF